MLLATALLISGLVLLAFGADRLVFSAVTLSRCFNLPSLYIGMTVVSIGTSLPEIVISIFAASKGQLDIAVGTAIGSNITHILLILGSSTLLRPLIIQSQVMRRDLLLMLLITLLCGVALFDNVLSRYDGMMLVTFAAAYMLLVISTMRRTETEEEDVNGLLLSQHLTKLSCKDAGINLSLLWLVVALVILPVSTCIVIDNVTLIATMPGVSNLLIGLTVIAVGTNLPALATVLAGTLKGENDIVIGNLIGSNIYNIAIVLGISALMHPGVIDANAFARDYWVMLAVSILLILLCLKPRRYIGRIIGALLLCGFFGWLASLYANAR